MTTSKREWHEPGPGEKSGWGTWGKPQTTYDIFMEEQGVPIYRDIGIQQVRDLPLKPWDRLGGKGTFIQLDGTEGLWGMYLVEVPPRGALNPEHHMYEEIHFVVEGRGSTEVWQHGSTKKQTFEWGPGSLFAIPLNANHRIVNATSSPALLLTGTSAPNVMDLFLDANYVFNTDYAFTDRFDGSDEYYKEVEEYEPDPRRGLAQRTTNIIPDIVNCELPLDNRRSPGYRRVLPHMGSGNFGMFCGEHETGRYSKAHRHGSGAVLICISGKGFSYTWPSELGTQPWVAGNGESVRRQDYAPVGMVSAAPMSGDWFHQHFGVAKEPLRLLVFSGPRKSSPGRPGSLARDDSSIDVKEGGRAIAYRDQDPHINEEYERMLDLEGAEGRMTDDALDAKFEFSGSHDS